MFAEAVEAMAQLYDDIQEVVELLSSLEQQNPDVTGNPVWREMVTIVNERWATFWDERLDDD